MNARTRRALPDRSTLDLSSAAPEAYVFRYNYDRLDAAVREEVQAATIAISTNLNRATESILAAGRELIRIKGMLAYGQWSEWIDTEFALSERMAQNMMSAARTYGDNPQRVAGLSASVIYLLAAPSTPESARREIEQQIAGGAPNPGRREARAIIEKHKALAPKPEPMEPPTPADLHEAGFAIEMLPDGRYRWLSERGTGVPCIDREDAIDAARIALSLRGIDNEIDNEIDAVALLLELVNEAEDRGRIDAETGGFLRQWLGGSE